MRYRQEEDKPGNSTMDDTGVVGYLNDIHYIRVCLYAARDMDASVLVSGSIENKDT